MARLIHADHDKAIRRTATLAFVLEYTIRLYKPNLKVIESNCNVLQKLTLSLIKLPIIFQSVATRWIFLNPD